MYAHWSIDDDQGGLHLVCSDGAFPHLTLIGKPNSWTSILMPRGSSAKAHGLAVYDGELDSGVVVLGFEPLGDEELADLYREVADSGLRDVLLDRARVLEEDAHTLEKRMYDFTGVHQLSPKRSQARVIREYVLWFDTYLSSFEPSMQVEASTNYTN